MKDIPTPTTRELEILKILWELGPNSVKAVHRALCQKEAKNKDLAYNTVQTLLWLLAPQLPHVDHPGGISSPK